MTEHKHCSSLNECVIDSLDVGGSDTERVDADESSIRRCTAHGYHADPKADQQLQILNSSVFCPLAVEVVVYVLLIKQSVI